MREIPEYLKIADTLQEEITNIYRPGDKLPSEYTLSGRFNVSRYVIRQALTRLAQVGLITSHQGIGYFVSGKPLEISYTVTPVTQFSKIIKGLGRTPGALLIDGEEVEAPFHVADMLNIKTGDKVFRLDIVRSADNVPLTYNITWLPSAYFPNLLEEVQNLVSLYAILRDKYNVSPIRMNSAIRSVFPYARDAKYLNISPNTPILQIESLVKDEDDRYIEYTVARYRGDLCSVSIELSER